MVISKYVIDTNGLINNPHIIKGKNIIITSLVLRELEGLEKRKGDNDLQYSIRVAKRIIEEALNDTNMNIDIVDIDNGVGLDGYDDEYVDNKIIKYAMDNDYGIVSDDILLKHKAVSKGIEVISSKEKNKDEKYSGFKEVFLKEYEVEDFYTNLTRNKFKLLTNEFLIIRDLDGTLIDTLKWSEKKGHISIQSNGRGPLRIGRSKQFKQVVARDPYQEMAIHSMGNTQVSMIRGKAGSGKTLIALSHAWRQVERNNARLVIFFNPAPSKDSIEMGFFKGDLIEKAMQSSLGAMLKSKFGDEDYIKSEIAYGNIEIFPFTDLRGWDSKSERKTVVLISESQNLTSELLKMGLQRIDDDTKVIIDGDYNQQVDKDVYMSNNGMIRASEVLRGSELYSEVELQNVYRSKLADAVEDM